jgi:hypothetical protein
MKEGKMDTLLAVIASIFALYLLRYILRYRKFLDLRFKLFKLRDEVLWIAIDGHISKDEAINLYNTINWPVRYVRNYPVLFLIGLAIAFEELNLPETKEEIRKKLENMPEALRDWFFRLSELTAEGIETYTPLGIIVKHPWTERLLKWPMIIWLFTKLIRLRNHPLRHSAIGQITFAAIKREEAILSKTQKTALEFQEAKLGFAH